MGIQGVTPVSASEHLSVVVPVYNEIEVLPVFHQRLMSVLADLDIPSRVLYVDDGSEDASGDWLQALAAAEAQVGVLQLSRNFGKEAALAAGLDHATGAAVVVMDADLQDPPELIVEFVAQWRAGYDVVYGLRASRPGDSWLKATSARGFYRLINRLSDVEIPRDTGDFRLLSRRAVDAVASLREQHRYSKGLFAWIGFPQQAVPYHRQARSAGASKWSYWRLWNLALEGLTSFSAVPLKLATYLGALTAGAAFLYGLYFLLRTLLMGNPVPGYPSLIIIILFLGGVQLMCLGIIGEYLGRTYNEAKGRSLYFVKGHQPAQSQADEDARD